MREDDIYSFQGFTLSAPQRALYEGSQPIRLGTRALEILLLLVSRAGELVSKEELMARAWPDTTVDENALRVHLSAVRKALGETSGGVSRFILNETGRGYRFVAKVVRNPVSASPQETGRASPPLYLPSNLSRMIGRDEIVAGLVALFPERRLLTIAGPGGIGKTTVALAVAHAMASSSSIRVCFVDLAPLSDPALVAGALASQLGLAVSSGAPEQAVLAALRGEPVLLVLDNCEHLIDVVATLTESILQGAPDVMLLVTSREPLRADGEWVYRLPTLQVPSPAAKISVEEALAFPAVQLFCEKAVASSDSFVFTDDEVLPVIDICNRLDGMPLAIEMAAARMDILDVRDLALRLDDRFALLTRGRRTALPRQQTLRATLDWSHDLLGEREKAVFRKLSVFRSSFPLESAVAVCTGPDLSEADVFDALTALVAKSLVTMDRRDRTVLYRLLDTTRFYAADKLALSGEQGEAFRRHAIHCVNLFADPTASWDGKDPRQWLAIHSWRVDDLRTAFDWAFSAHGDPAIGLALVVASAPLWFHLSLPNEYLAIARRAKKVIAGTDLEGSVAELELMASFGHALWHTSGPVGDMDDAFRRSMEIAEAQQLEAHGLRAVWGLWACNILAGNYAESLTLARAFEAPAYKSGDLANIQTADHMLALSHHFMGDQKRALDLLNRVIAGDEAPARANHTNHAQVDGRTATLALLMRILWLTGHADRALQVARDCAADVLSLDHDLSICYGLAIGCIPVAIWTGELDLARGLNVHLAERTKRRGLRHWQIWADGFEIALGSHRSLPGDGSGMQDETFATLSPRTVGGNALARLARERDLWCAPELMRLKAEELLETGAEAAAENAEAKLREALDLAGRQGALAWGLRIATSFARLLDYRGRRAEAKEALGGVLARFEEGTATSDMTKARALLKTLS
ncbi:winged helix-turn-helix domain-containing protein [Rhizobium puerariae]|uniref:Winged helix-turn-helix domain-containing protein n=1 Tax=Rhizobium puerariae TaxID=1585791 RepID=A0ABV6AER5_9HYPH